MEEYKRIIKLIFVPSFFCLLSSASVILLSYSFYFDSKGWDRAAGLILFSVSFPIMILYLKNIARQKFLLVILFICIPVLVFLRVSSFCRYNPEDKNISEYKARAISILARRYSNEVILRFSDKPDVKASSGWKAVAYINKDIKINPGDELLIFSKPREISINAANPSFSLNLLRKGIHYSFYINQKNFKVTTAAPVKFKNNIRDLIGNNLIKLFDKKTVPVLKGLYFANGSYIDKSTTNDFKRAGVLHILSASGEHIGIIAGALLLMLTPFLINKKFLHIIISIVLLFYLYITDMPVSLLRAFIMYYIFSIQYIFDLEKNIINVLFISGLIILFIFPYELFSLGFQLSFGATFGIIVFNKFMRDAFSFLPGKISGVISATFSAQIFVFPVIFANLKEINLTGLISNIILIFTMSATLIISIIANIISIISYPLAKFFAIITDISYSFSFYLIKYLSSSNGHFSIHGNSYILLILYILFLFPIFNVTKNRKILASPVILSIICAWFLFNSEYPVEKNKIIYLDRDDKALIFLNEGHDPILFGYLMDIQSAEILTEYLNSNNIRNLNIFISVPDYINLKNFTYLIKRTLVSQCFISRDFRFGKYFNEFCGLLDNDGIKLRIIDFNKKTTENDEKYFSEIFMKSSFDDIDIAEISNLFYKGSEGKNYVFERMLPGYELEYLE